jgi:hypothetical protein
MTNETIRRILVIATPLVGAVLSASIGYAGVPLFVAATAGAVAGILAVIIVSAGRSCVSLARLDATA